MYIKLTIILYILHLYYQQPEEHIFNNRTIELEIIYIIDT